LLRFVIRGVIQTVIRPQNDTKYMAPILTARISEGMKSEIEELVEDKGMWASRTEFVKEALNQQIKRYWTGDRYANTPRRVEDQER